MLLLETEDRLVRRAIEFATKAHSHQIRVGTKDPYITHPLAVAHAIMDKYPSSSNILIAASVLHDTKEDGVINGKPVTYENLITEFGLPIANLVNFLSRGNEPYFVYIHRIARGRTDGIIIKLEDCLHNLSSPGKDSLNARYEKAIKTLSGALAKRLAVTVTYI